jgi:hypothetical protein
LIKRGPSGSVALCGVSAAGDSGAEGGGYR